MPQPRSYKLLCPIARALDAVGDRWSLLILRDLHAGPARFADLQKGLTGIASNLLTERLAHLANEGFLEKVSGPYGISLYQLTPVGWSTRGLLFDLARIGGQLSPVENPKRPGNLRTIAVTLAAALERADTGGTDFRGQLAIDGEVFSIAIKDNTVSVLAGEDTAASITMATSYAALMAASTNALPLEQFVAAHVQFSGGSPADKERMVALMGAAMAQLQ